MRQAALDERLLGQVFSTASDRRRAAFVESIQGNLAAFLSLVWRDGGRSPGAVDAAFDLVLRRKGIQAEALAAQRDAVLGGKYPLLRPRLQELADVRMRIAKKTLAGHGPEGAQSHQQVLAQWAAQRERLQAELARQIPEMNVERQLGSIDRQAVARALPDGSALVEFVRFRAFDFEAAARGKQLWQPSRYLAFVLPAGAPERAAMVDLGEAEPIDRLIGNFRDEVTGKAGPGGGAFAGERLRAAVFDPLSEALGDCRRLFLAPDGDLCLLPFGALPQTDGRRLLDRYRLGYLSAGRDVLRFSSRSGRRPAEPAVFADPDFDLGPPAEAASPCEGAARRVSRDLDRGRRFGRLAGARVEGERVAARLGVQPFHGGRSQRRGRGRLRASGIEEVQITLFGTAAEQELYNRNSAEEYERIMANVRSCVEHGLRVQVNNVLSRETMDSMELLADECVRLGVHRLRFIRLQPIGDAVRAFAPDVYLHQTDLEEVIIPTVERLKGKYGARLYLCFAVNFGPNFHGKTLEEAREKIRRRSPQSPPSDTFCPAIDGQYWNVSTQSGHVHWCFHNIGEAATRIGKVDWGTGRVTIDRPVDLSRETLRRKLRGICAAEACPYQEVCLGGCRSAAISFAGDDDPEERLYARQSSPGAGVGRPTALEESATHGTA
jgi:radical SAM protein with 4Fe4S-binding SPASM domain